MYSKPDCHLCDVAKAVVERVRRRVPFEFRVVDISADASLLERYQFEIPVVFVNGRKAFKGRVNEAELERKLQA